MSDWIITDPSCNQQCRVIDNFRYEFKEDRLINPDTGEKEVYASTIDLHDYSQEEIMDNLTPFGYKKSGDLIHDCEGNEVPNQVIAECIFELKT